MKKRLLNLFMIPMLVLQLCTVSHAAEAEDIQQKETSVLQIVVLYTDEEGTEHPVQGGTGFLIGEEETGAEYVVTAKEVTSVPKETEEQIKQLYVNEDKTSQITYGVKAVIKRDVMIDLQLVAESDEMGFAVWKMSQPLYDRQALILCDEPLTGVSGQKAVVLGFPTAPSLTGETVYYAMDEMISKNGMLIGDGSDGNIKYLYHNITPNQGMIGGPILNEDGNVVALNQTKEAQEGYFALQISELLPVLEALGIPYITTGEVEDRIQAELAAMVHKEELQEEIKTAEVLDKGLYYKKSYAVLEESLSDAKAVNDNDAATQEEVDAASEKLGTAIAGLEEKPPLWLIILIAVISVAIISVAVIVVLKKTKTKREQRKQKKLEEITVTQAAPVFTENADKTGYMNRKDDYKRLVIQNSQELNAKVGTEPQRADEVYGETTVFQQDTDNSMDLNKDDKVKRAYLIRRRTGERIAITEREVVLGKDPSQTDYCITGNSAISRVHAVIIYNGTGYDVSDKNATNGTFVNGVKVAAFQKTPLRNGDILRLSDEDFEFKTGN